jgi:hypothetical protein
MSYRSPIRMLIPKPITTNPINQLWSLTLTLAMGFPALEKSLVMIPPRWDVTFLGP